MAGCSMDFGISWKTASSRKRFLGRPIPALTNREKGWLNGGFWLLKVDAGKLCGKVFRPGWLGEGFKAEVEHISRHDAPARVRGIDPERGATVYLLFHVSSAFAQDRTVNCRIRPAREHRKFHEGVEEMGSGFWRAGRRRAGKAKQKQGSNSENILCNADQWKVTGVLRLVRRAVLPGH